MGHVRPDYHVHTLMSGRPLIGIAVVLSTVRRPDRRTASGTVPISRRPSL